jgi:hypothetical protein
MNYLIKKSYGMPFQNYIKEKNLVSKMVMIKTFHESNYHDILQIFYKCNEEEC